MRLRATRFPGGLEREFETPMDVNGPTRVLDPHVGDIRLAAGRHVGSARSARAAYFRCGTVSPWSRKA
jgi:hypothetical protein